MSGNPRICPVNTQFWPDIVRCPTVICSSASFTRNYILNSTWRHVVLNSCLVSSTYRYRRLVSVEKTFSGSWVIWLYLRSLEMKRHLLKDRFQFTTITWSRINDQRAPLCFWLNFTCTCNIKVRASKKTV